MQLPTVADRTRRIEMAPPASWASRPTRLRSKNDSFGFALMWILVFAVPWGDMVQLSYDIQASRVFALVVAVAWGIALWRSRVTQPLRGSHWWMILFVLWAAADILWTLDPKRSFRRSLSYYELFLMAWLVYQATTNIERYRKLLFAYIAGCYVAFAGLAYNFLSQVSSGDGRYTAPGFDPNDLAVTLALGVPIAWYLAISVPSFRWATRSYIPCAIVAALLTASRGALITLVICLTFPLLSLPRLSLRTLASAIIVCCLSVLVVIVFWNDTSVQRLSTITEQMSARDLNGRVEIWGRGFEVFAENPLAGVGGGSFASALGAVGKSYLAAHNVVLGVAVEHGLVGVTLFVGTICSIFLNAWRAPKRERQLWIIIMLGWCAAASTLSWENRETTWLLWGLCVAQPAFCYRRLHNPNVRSNYARA